MPFRHSTACPSGKSALMLNARYGGVKSVFSAPWAPSFEMWPGTLLWCFRALLVSASPRWNMLVFSVSYVSVPVFRLTANEVVTTRCHIAVTLEWMAKSGLKPLRAHSFRVLLELYSQTRPCLVLLKQCIQHEMGGTHNHIRCLQFNPIHCLQHRWDCLPLFLWTCFNMKNTQTHIHTLFHIEEEEESWGIKAVCVRSQVNSRGMFTL